MQPEPNIDPKTLELIDAFGAFMASEWHVPNTPFSQQKSDAIHAIGNFSIDGPIDYDFVTDGATVVLFSVIIVGILAYKALIRSMENLFYVVLVGGILFSIVAFVNHLYYEYVHGICL